MTDVFSKEERSEIMKKVHSSGNASTELKIIKIFRDNKVKGWRRGYPIFGKPDFIFPKQRIALFVDGCFWHGHNCRNLSPAYHREYWVKKIERNKNRDVKVTQFLINKNWTVIRIWECEINADVAKRLKIMLS
jgi:DNA mismatch endonuclease (patch repair protein)